MSEQLFNNICLDYVLIKPSILKRQSFYNINIVSTKKMWNK